MTHFVRHTSALLAALATAFAAQAAWATPRYHLTDIPTDDTGAYATAINAHGDVAFQSGSWNTEFFDYVDRQGVVTQVNEQDYDMSGFNDHGDFVGVGYDENLHGFLAYLPGGNWGGVVTPSFDYTGVARGGIADNLVVVASATVPGKHPNRYGQRCFRWREGVTLSQMKTQGDVCSVSAVSPHAVATGGVNKRPGDPVQAYVWAPGHFQMLGTLGGPTSTGLAVNDLGHVALDSDLVPDANGVVYQHAALYDGTALVDLGTLPGDLASFAAGMNDLDEVVGTSRGAAADRQFLYTGGQMLALDDLIDNLPAGTLSYYVSGINHRGQIAGTRTDTSGLSHPFVLKRVAN